MLLQVAKVALLLTLFIQYIEGFKRVIEISESNDHDELSSDGIVTSAIYIGNVSGSYILKNSCCIYGNCSCPSLYKALINLNSNVLINITTDVELSSIIQLVDLANITITGHNNPTVNCHDSGGLHFISCYNCTIEGIIWERCGARNISNDGNVYPVLQLFNSSDTILENCSFQNSIGQAIVLSEMSGSININNCNFLFNKQFEGHGTAIHYSSDDTLTSSSIVLVISNCNYFYNQNAKSVVYFGQSSKLCEYLILQNSKFHRNRGTPIYVINQNLYMNGKIEFYQNVAENGGGIFISDHSNVTFHKSAIVNFTQNTANNNGGAIFLINQSSILFKDHPTALHQCHELHITIGYHYLDGISLTVTFLNNSANKFGAYIYVHSSNITIGDTASVMFKGDRLYNTHSSFLYIEHYSAVTFEGKSTAIFYENAALKGGVVYCVLSTVTFEGNSTAMFRNTFGGVVHCVLSAVNFKGNSKVMFYRNRGGMAMSIADHSNITFEENSTVTFNYNIVFSYGGVVHINFSEVTFKGNCTVIFHNNLGGSGGIMYIIDHLNNTFQGNCTVIFDDNKAYGDGIMYINDDSNVTFEGNSTVILHNNVAYNSYTMIIADHSSITFEGYSTVTFDDNEVTYNGGAVYSVLSAVTIKGNCEVTFQNNIANSSGTMYIDNHSNITFEENSTVTFDDNLADIYGGAMYIVHSVVTFKGSSKVRFHNNTAKIGGTMYIDNQSNITFEGNSALTFDGNEAHNGGAVYIILSTITIKGNCKIIFHNNIANNNGGSMYIDDHSNITFKGNSTVTFNNGLADIYGGAVYCVLSAVTFKGSCRVTFINNVAYDGGTMYIDDQSNIKFEKNSTVTFDTSEAINNGAAVYCVHSRIIFNGNSKVIFEENEAKSNGGAMYVVSSNMTFQGNSIVTFYNNTANTNGGAYYVHNSYVISRDFSSITFNRNTALQDGGAIYLSLSVSSYFQHVDKSNIMFNNNSAGYYGGAVYIPLTTSILVDTLYISADIYLNGNAAWRVPNAVYLYIANICDNSCLMQYISGVTLNWMNYTNIATNPNKLILYNPAICSNGSDTNCDTYYMNNVMLGQEITFDACVLDYLDQPIEATQFVITGLNHEDYKITGPTRVTISCSYIIQGITIIGNLHSNSSYNYSIIISPYVTNLEPKMLSVNLVIELSQCHPGFWDSRESQKCECYNTNDIISCSSNSSTIKRGYWFGIVTGKPTVTSCPSDFCNFTCCEITNGIYHLSPIRANQCRPHRCGTACGNCEKGYTLSFDSPECVDINECSIGQTILVTILSLLYWIAVVVTVFTLTYFKVTVGSLYAIIYYYSVMDILLNPVLFISNRLYKTVNIISSLTKLTPQFLGQLCLVREMSGIDQQFIHYAHPAAVLFILIMISILARKSSKVSSFVSRGIIPFICFLILLSYTSMATTSLLLMRPLTFVDVDEVYTYLSPDIQYLHGRHIAYIIPAIIFTIVIVIGFPLLLLLEPFFNSKINFIKIKPLLDQFQGCYKDKYRGFAGYYMILSTSDYSTYHSKDF